MSSYTEENLDKLLKKNLIAIVLAKQSKISANSAEGIPKLNRKFYILQPDLLVTKKVNSELSSWLVNMERQCWANTQCLRRECLEVVGIPREVE